VSPGKKIHGCGDDLISIDVSSPAEAQVLAERLRATGDWFEVVGGIDSVVLRFDAATHDPDFVVRKAHETTSLDAPVVMKSVDVVEIPVCYGGEFGPDFDAVCAMLKLSGEELIALHAGHDYTVDMLGFTPGFAYIGGLDERLCVPRLREPRVSIAAGSVGIADADLVIVTLDDFEATEDVVAALRQIRPNVTILVRGHNAEQCRTLQKLGASLVVSENLEASLELAREALIRDEGDAAEVESIILHFRDAHYAGVEGEKRKKTSDQADE